VSPRPLTFVAADGSRLPYLLHLPPGHAAPGWGGPRRRWPVILFLHGAGERGADPAKLLRTGLPALLLRRPDLPAVVVAPQCSAETTWLDHVEGLLELLADVEANLAGDASRVHLTGLSMGGMGAWLLGALAPERFASVVPICGPVPPLEGFLQMLGALADTPVWAFHGAQDEMVPVRHTLAAVEALERAGGRPRLTIYADVGHRSWEPAYADPALWRWFLGTPRPAARR
jgi:predicted peptidase